MRRVQMRGGARWQATRGLLPSGECGAMSGPRRRKFVSPIVSRVTWHGGRGTPYLRRWALIIALVAEHTAAEQAKIQRHEHAEHEGGEHGHAGKVPGNR